MGPNIKAVELEALVIWVVLAFILVRIWALMAREVWW
jgi:hypothetical protein